MQDIIEDVKAWLESPIGGLAVALALLVVRIYSQRGQYPHPTELRAPADGPTSKGKRKEVTDDASNQR